MLRKIAFSVILLILLAGGLYAEKLRAAEKKNPVYISFFIHCESSPIRGVPISVQNEPWDGTGLPPRTRYLDRILDICEQYNIKFEFCVTPVFAQQLREDRPDIIERIKRMRLPISRYPSLAGHVLPPPIGELRDMPGMRLTQLRNREIQWEDYLRNEWTSETRTLVPRWHFEGNRLVMSNPLSGTAIRLKQLADYRIPEKSERLFGGTLALEEIFDVIPMPTFPALFKGDVSRLRTTTVHAALGMGSYEYSRQPISAFNAPFRATDSKMVDWFKEHFPIDQPLHSDVSFGYTHSYNGAPVRTDFHEGIIKYIVEHPDDFQIVWPDPEGIQYLPENRPKEFFKRTYGIETLEEVMQMPVPIKKLITSSATPPVRAVEHHESVPRTGWQKDLLLTMSELGVSSSGQSLPDFLRPSVQTLLMEDAFVTARYIVENMDLPANTDDQGSLPSSILLNGKTIALGDAFIGLASMLTYFSLHDVLPPSVEISEMIGPVDYPWAPVASASELDRQVDRIDGVPDNPHFNEVNLLQTIWEVHEQITREQKIPGRILTRLSRNIRGNYTGVRSRINAAELLYAMAKMMTTLEQQGIPRAVPFRRVTMVPKSVAASAAGSSPAWLLHTSWMQPEFQPAQDRTVKRSEMLEAAEYLMVAWTAGHLGHSEDLGGPPYAIRLKNGDDWSLNDGFQALAYSLAAWAETGTLPDQMSIKDVLGPVDYPMYDLQGEPMYNTRMIRGGWQPYQVDIRNFPDPNDINKQGLPGPGHGGYIGFETAEDLMQAVQLAVGQLRDKGMVPGSLPMRLSGSRRSGPYPRSTDDTPYVNAGELLWGMAQLYRYIAKLGRTDDVYMRSCRIIKDQLHYYCVGINPVGFSQSTYRYRQDSFDWIEKVPTWRLHQTWAGAGN
jgi:hypothetical protein